MKCAYSILLPLLIALSLFALATITVIQNAKALPGQGPLVSKEVSTEHQLYGHVLIADGSMVEFIDQRNYATREACEEAASGRLHELGASLARNGVPAIALTGECRLKK